MILHRKSWLVFKPDSCHGIVIQVHVGYFYFRIFLGVFTYNIKSVILRSYFTLTRDKVFNRMVNTSMTSMHFIG